MLFFSDPGMDLNVIIYLSAFALVISLGVYIFTKKILLTTTIFSILENLVFYLNSGSELFDIYNVKWIVVFTLDFWPIINLILFGLIIFNFLKNRNAKTK